MSAAFGRRPAKDKDKDKDKDKKTYKKTDYEETYLDSKEGMQELYKLFIFVFLFELHIQKIEV